jgi:hypothetical protein
MVRDSCPHFPALQQVMGSRCGISGAFQKATIIEARKERLEGRF